MNHAEALHLWHNVHSGIVRDHALDLTTRQMAILLTVYLEKPPHTVRGLAQTLNVTKPVITRALDTMGKEGLIARRRDENDRRNVIIQRTLDGSLYLDKLGERIVATANDLHTEDGES